MKITTKEIINFLSQEVYLSQGKKSLAFEIAATCFKQFETDRGNLTWDEGQLEKIHKTFKEMENEED